jgi:hypothetical protein
MKILTCVATALMLSMPIPAWADDGGKAPGPQFCTVGPPGLTHFPCFFHVFFADLGMVSAGFGAA